MLITVLIGAIHVGCELFENIALFDTPIAAGFVFDCDLVDSLFGLPVAVGNDNNSVVEVDDLPDTRHVLYGSRVHRLDAIPKCRRCFHGRIFHAGQYYINAETGGAVDFRRHVQARHGPPHDRKFFLGLERRFGWYGEFRRLCRECRIRRGAVAWRMVHMTVLCLQLFQRYLPGVRGGLR